jgi:hypothetical protein
MQMLQCTVLHIVQDRQNLKHFFYARDLCISSKFVLDSVAILTWKSSKFAKLWILIMVALTKLLDSPRRSIKVQTKPKTVDKGKVQISVYKYTFSCLLLE